VSILAWNGLEYLEAYFAAAGIGAILNPLNARLAPREIGEVLAACGSRVLIVDPDLGRHAGNEIRIGAEYEAELERNAGELVAVDSADADVAHLYFTSGTTGLPKGVMLTQRNVCAHAQGAIDELGLSAGDTWAHIAPMFHLADAWATFAITQVGGVHAMLPRFEPEAALALIERERVTITNLVPTMLNLMTRHPRAKEFDTASLRMILSGGAPIAPALVREIVELFGCEYVQTYGMTETSPYLTLSLLKEHLKTLPPDEQLAIRCKTGRAFKTVELKVVDEHGREVARDDHAVGEILARGETVTPGYWNDPEATRAAFDDGWLRTGDLAVVDAEGYLTIVDRKKDMILTGGENVYSIEVENALHAHPGVMEAAVFGARDEVLGEIVKAAVVLKPGARASADELRTFCRERLAGYKVPRAVEFFDALPRTGSGKIAKRSLRDR